MKIYIVKHDHIDYWFNQKAFKSKEKAEEWILKDLKKGWSEDYEYLNKEYETYDIYINNERDMYKIEELELID